MRAVPPHGAKVRQVTGLRVPFRVPDAVYFRREPRQLEFPTHQAAPECVPFVEQQSVVFHFVGHMVWCPARVRAVKDGAECIPLIERMAFNAERAKRAQYQDALADIEHESGRARWGRLCRRWATKHEPRAGA